MKPLPQLAESKAPETHVASAQRQGASAGHAPAATHATLASYSSDDGWHVKPHDVDPSAQVGEQGPYGLLERGESTAAPGP